MRSDKGLKNMKLTIHNFNHELKHPFTISRWTYTHTKSMVVELSKDGVKGFGEATHNPYYPNTDIEFMMKRLNVLEEVIAENAHLAPEQFWIVMNEHLHDCPFALCALDEAFHDLHARAQNKTLSEAWGLDIRSDIPQCYTLSIDDYDIMINRMKEKPWAIYKIKLGTDNDIDMVEALRQHTDARFWADVNCAWQLDDAFRKSRELKKLGVELLEQPLPVSQWEEMDEMFHKSSIPLIADESCKVIGDITKCVGKFHGVNIKVMKCGGLTPAKEMIKEARKHQLKVMVGCMAESTVGISAIAHLASLIDYADMDGQHFIKNDPATGVLVKNQEIVFPESTGSGVYLL